MLNVREGELEWWDQETYATGEEEGEGIKKGENRR